jgi:hypothetical protein
MDEQCMALERYGFFEITEIFLIDKTVVFVE